MIDEQIFSRRRILIAGGVLFLSPLLLGSGEAQAESEATMLVNKIRLQHGVPPLVSDARLESAALFQARLMARHGKIGHNIGWGNTFTGRLRKAGIRGPAAENVASGQKDVADALTAWMKSAGHRINLLDPVFTRYGLAFAIKTDKPNYRYWAMLYGV